LRIALVDVVLVLPLWMAPVELDLAIPSRTTLLYVVPDVLLRVGLVAVPTGPLRIELADTSLVIRPLGAALVEVVLATLLRIGLADTVLAGFLHTALADVVPAASLQIALVVDAFLAFRFRTALGEVVVLAFRRLLLESGEAVLVASFPEALIELVVGVPLGNALVDAFALLLRIALVEVVLHDSLRIAPVEVVLNDSLRIAPVEVVLNDSLRIAPAELVVAVRRLRLAPMEAVLDIRPLRRVSVEVDPLVPLHVELVEVDLVVPLHTELVDVVLDVSLPMGTPR